jgi:hypothetical protein
MVIMFGQLPFVFLHTGQWQFVGLDKPIRIFIGEEVVSSASSLLRQMPRPWKCGSLNDYFSDLVHLYQDGKDKKDMQMPAYQGRTELVKDFIVDGHVFPRLQKVTPSDAGLYGFCFSSQTHEQKAIWELQVAVQLLISENSYLPCLVESSWAL